MNDLTATRKLAAILVADVVGYSRLMAHDDAATLDALNASRAILRGKIDEYAGRVIDMAGDSALAVFASALEAVRCAMAVQSCIEEKNLLLPEIRRMQYRIGISLGDVLQQSDGTVYGDGVNIAARLESLSVPGGITISGSIHEQVKSRLPVRFEFLGDQAVKNIPEPVPAYRVSSDTADSAATKGKTTPGKRHHGKFSWRIGAALTFAILIAALAWSQWRSYRAAENLTANTSMSAQLGVGVAVLPFENLSGDASQDFFADGITTELITSLGRFQNLRVAAKHNSFRYRGKAQDTRTVGNELRVRYLLTGSVSRSPEAVRVTAQLVQVDSESQIWSQTYQRPLNAKNVFDIQQEVSLSIASAIGSRSGIVLRAEGTQSQVKPPTDLSAYECFMRWVGVYQRTISKEGHAAVLDCLERAVKLDPNYAEAWAALADVYNDQYRLEYNPGTGSPLDRALRAAERAVELNPESQNAYKSLAVNRYLRGEREEFFAAADHAIRLGPNEPNILAGLSNYMYYAGDRKKALALLKRALELDMFPVDWYYFPLYWEHYRAGDYEAALAEAQKMNMPAFLRAHAARVAALGQLGRVSEADPYIRRIRELDPEFEAQAWSKLGKVIKYDSKLIEQFVAGLRKAGMNIPERSG